MPTQMEIIEWQQFIENGFSSDGKLVSMTVGIFDGVHRGHQVLLRQVVSHNADYEPVVVTFRQNHKTYNHQPISNNAQQKEIISFQERLTMFKNIGIKTTIIVDFSQDFRQMLGKDFLQILLDHCNIGFFAIGCDFKCGYKLDTDAKSIQKFFSSHNIPVEIVPQIMEGSLPISSSRIREAISDGDLTLAKSMLGQASPFFAI